MEGISTWSRYWSRFGGNRVALIAESGDRTWRDLEDACAEVAAGLRAAGVSHGDRVGGLMRNVPEHFELVLACARLGAVFVPVNPLLTAPEITALAADADLAGVVTDASFAPVLPAVDAAVGPDRVWCVDPSPAGRRAFASLREHGRVDENDAVRLDDPMMICYTSGTTGRSKGAVLTHRNLEGVAQGVIAMDALTRDDRAIVTVPLAFTGAGVSFAIPILRVGGSLVVREGLDPVAVLDDIEHGGVTMIGVVPLVLARLAAAPGFEDRDLSGLRVAKAGGAAVPEHLLRTWLARGVRLVNAYGLTEGAGMNLQLPVDEALRRIGSVGMPLFGQETRVVAADGSDCPPGRPGELWLRGDAIFAGYWRDPESTAQTLRDGWLRTGDLATVDEDGFLRIVDRSKDMIISGGINVYPAEVESVLVGHPDVDEVAVIGAPDPEWGEVPVACVVSPRPDLTLEELTAYAAESLARYKRPRRVVLVDGALPRGMSGKVLKRELRASLHEQADASPA